MVIISAISGSSSSLSFHKSPSINIPQVRSKIIINDDSPDTKCFCFPFTKLENSKDIFGKSY